VIRLSVNVNKVATLRNSRGGMVPNVLEAVRVVLAGGAPGITVHPRADGRHITSNDVREIARELEPWRGTHPQRAHSRGPVEFNIEGDPRPDLMTLVHEVRPDQCTLVPVLEREVTSQGRWPAAQAGESLRGSVDALRKDGVRVSLFIDPDPELVKWAAEMGADRVELFTEPFARAFERSHDEARLRADDCARAAEVAHGLGLGVNAGHDLDHRNLVLFRSVPYVEEVSIGHALISRALFQGLETTVREYLAVLEGK
jgi:pyridoxine 5-phosphate synthase